MTSPKYLQNLAEADILTDEEKLLDEEALNRLANVTCDAFTLDPNGPTMGEQEAQRASELSSFNQTAVKLQDAEQTLETKPLSYPDHSLPAVRKLSMAISRALTALRYAAKNEEGNFKDPAVLDAMNILQNYDSCPQSKLFTEEQEENARRWDEPLDISDRECLGKE